MDRHFIRRLIAKRRIKDWQAKEKYPFKVGELISAIMPDNEMTTCPCRILEVDEKKDRFHVETLEGYNLFFVNTNIQITHMWVTREVMLRLTIIEDDAQER